MIEVADPAPFVSLAQNDGHPRHGRRREGANERRPLPNHTRPLLPHAGHEAGGVDENDQWHAEAIADLDEAGGLLGGLSVEHAAKVAGLIGDQAPPGGLRSARTR
jgi:hypothetical protein